MTKWSERLETHHREIDDAHREFLRLLEDIKEAVDDGAGRERIVELILILQRYVLVHFENEEAYMLRVGCPAHAANCSAHSVFREKLEHWLTILTMSGSPVSVLMDVHRESSAWIESHILNIDCKLRGCPKG